MHGMYLHYISIIHAVLMTYDKDLLPLRDTSCLRCTCIYVNVMAMTTKRPAEPLSVSLIYMNSLLAVHMI